MPNIIETYHVENFTHVASTLFPQLESSVDDFRAVQDSLAEVRERYKNGSSSVNDLARELAQASCNCTYHGLCGGWSS